MNRDNNLRAHWRRIVGRFYLAYLLILPLGATAAGAALYRGEGPGTAALFAVFIGGILVVSVYTAAMTTYVGMPRSMVGSLLVLIDGPVVLGIALVFPDGAGVWHALAADFLIEALPLFLALGAESLRSALPTRVQRIGSLFIALAATAAVGVVLGVPVYQRAASGPVWGWVSLLYALISGCVINWRLLRHDRVLRDPFVSGKAIVIVSLLWIAVFIIAVNGRNAGWLNRISIDNPVPD